MSLDAYYNSGMMDTFHDPWVDEQEREWQADYDARMKTYNAHVADLKRQKDQFIKDNPDFPNPEILFMNVIAPPQRIILK